MEHILDKELLDDLGLNYCTVCKQAEIDLAKECPGRPDNPIDSQIMETEMNYYKIKKDYHSPFSDIKAGVIKSVINWRLIFPDLNSTIIKMKTDWFEEVKEPFPQSKSKPTYCKNCKKKIKLIRGETDIYTHLNDSMTCDNEEHTLAEGPDVDYNKEGLLPKYEIRKAILVYASHISKNLLTPIGQAVTEVISNILEENKEKTILEKFLEWNKKYPPQQAYSYKRIHEISGELSKIMTEAQEYVNKSFNVNKDCIWVEEKEGGEKYIMVKCPKCLTLNKFKDTEKVKKCVNRGCGRSVNFGWLNYNPVTMEDESKITDKILNPPEELIYEFVEECTYKHHVGYRNGGALLFMFTMNCNSEWHKAVAQEIVRLWNKEYGKGKEGENEF